MMLLWVPVASNQKWPDTECLTFSSRSVHARLNSMAGQELLIQTCGLKTRNPKADTSALEWGSLKGEISVLGELLRDG